jgi:signal transduction histidine kinase
MQAQPDASAQRTDNPHWRELLRTRGVLAMLAVELVVAALVVCGLWALRRQTLNSELAMLAALSAAMAAQADSTLDVADAALRATRAELEQGLLVPGTEAGHALLRTRTAALPKFKALVVLDAQGLRVAGSHDEATAAPSVAGHDFFVAARQTPAPTLFVGSPFISRADGRRSIGVSMDWRSRDGTFQGVVALAADPDFLDGGFERIAPTPDTHLAIYRRDRALVSDGPGDGSASLLPASVTDALWADAAPQLPRLVRLPDGRSRLVAAHLLQRFALMTVVTRDTDAVLLEWDEQAWLVGSLAASALVVTLLLTLRNEREQALRRASQAALAAEQQRALRAFDAAQEGHWEWNPVTRESHLSPRMKELLGVARDAPLGSDARLLAHGTLHPDDAAPLRDAFIAHSQGHSPSFDFSFRVRQAGGSWRHVRVRGHAERDASGTAVLFSGTGVDVSAEVEAAQHKRQLEDQLQRARKLQALGTLAGGVAHDFNNILAAIVGYGELAQVSAPQGSKLARHLDQVLRAGQRGKAVVERILSFSRSAPRQHQAMLLQPVVDEALQLLAASLPAKVHLQQQLDAAQACIAGDATMVLQATMNLCMNAVQAMPEGGTVQVTLTVIDRTEPLLLFENSLPPGRYARLAVTDGGPGIAPEVMPRLFEPFFTTKGPGRGTGLGLAVVHGVMAELGGGIDVQNMPGGGACFGLYFPCVDGPAPGDVSAAPASSPEPHAGQGQTVLVVDDEPALVVMTEELLAGLGYEPVGFSSSAAALAAFRAEPDRFDLVLTDELMPELPGSLLAAAVHALRPGLPIVMASGYGGPQLEERAAACGVSVLVRKPLVRAELAAAVQQALQRKLQPS